MVEAIAKAEITFFFFQVQEQADLKPCSKFNGKQYTLALNELIKRGLKYC